MSGLQLFLINRDHLLQLGENLKHKRSLATIQKATCDFTSIPGFVTKKNSSRGPKHGAFERQVMFFTAAIRRFYQDGMRKKNTESRWQSTILTKKKSCFTIASLL